MIGRVSFDVLNSAGSVVETIDPQDEYGILLATYSTPPPAPRIFRVEVEGRNGTLDMTEWAGDVFYNDRTVSISLRDMEGNANDLINRIIGRNVRVHFYSDIPGWYFQGRVESVNTQTEHHVTDIGLQVICHPFRYPELVNDMIPFESYKPGTNGQAYSGTRVIQTLAINNQGFNVDFTLHQQTAVTAVVKTNGLSTDVNFVCTVTINGVDYAIQSDESAVEIPIKPGANSLTFTVLDNDRAASMSCTFKDRVI